MGRHAALRDALGPPGASCARFAVDSRSIPARRSTVRRERVGTPRSGRVVLRRSTDNLGRPVLGRRHHAHGAVPRSGGAPAMQPIFPVRTIAHPRMTIVATLVESSASSARPTPIEAARGWSACSRRGCFRRRATVSARFLGRAAPSHRHRAPLFEWSRSSCAPSRSASSVDSGAEVVSPPLPAGGGEAHIPLHLPISGSASTSATVAFIYRGVGMSSRRAALRPPSTLTQALSRRAHPRSAQQAPSSSKSTCRARSIRRPGAVLLAAPCEKRGLFRHCRPCDDSERSWRRARARAGCPTGSI